MMSDVRTVVIKFTWLSGPKRFWLGHGDRYELHRKLEQGHGLIYLEGKGYNVQNIAWIEVEDAT